MEALSLIPFAAGEDDLAMFVDLREKHGVLGKDSNLDDFKADFKVAMARRGDYNQDKVSVKLRTGRGVPGGWSTGRVMAARR